MRRSLRNSILSFSLFGFVSFANASGLLPEDRIFTPEERRAMQEMREATKGDSNFVGDAGFYLGDSDHSSDCASCYEERCMWFFYNFPAPPLIGGVNTTQMCHRTPSATAPEEWKARLYRATRYLNVNGCVHVDGLTVTATPETCGFHVWAPVAPPPVSKPRPWYCAYGYLNEFGLPLFGCE